MFTLKMQDGTACYQHFQMRAGGQEFCHIRRGAYYLLEVVEHQQAALLAPGCVRVNHGFGVRLLSFGVSMVHTEFMGNVSDDSSGADYVVKGSKHQGVVEGE